MENNRQIDLCISSRIQFMQLSIFFKIWKLQTILYYDYVICVLSTNIAESFFSVCLQVVPHTFKLV